MLLNSIISALNSSIEQSKSPSKQFYVEDVLDCSDLNINITGIGPIQFPIALTDIELLLKASESAKFGFREQTLLDKAVRDTSEISSDKISVQINQKKLNQMLGCMREQLGLVEDTVLKPHLHNLLIYGPGQFFKPHQDSEKLEGMVATLVIILPSPHIGGDLIVEHKQHSACFESESIMPQSLKCAAFYADCQHEVKLVKQGYRIALTYNLVLESKAENKVLLSQKDHNPELIDALKAHFTKDSNDSNPVSLVYLLDHSYSEHSLRWPLLKGTDHRNALALKTAAYKLNLIPHLALTEIHQSWSTDGDEESPERYELIDEYMTFENWFDEHGNRLAYGDYQVSEDEMCSSQELEDCEPDRMEAEGWMGNYGNTADYWYRRAAVVLWRQEDQIVFNFLLNKEEALRQLTQLTESMGNEEQAKSILKRTHSLLKYHHYKSKNEFLNLITRLACYIRDEDMASTLLSKFLLKDLISDSANDIAQWQETYGLDWCLGQLRQWIQQDSSGYKNKPSLLQDIDKLILNLINQNIDTRIGVLFIEHQIEAIIANDKAVYRQRPSQEAKTISKRVTFFNQLLKACLLQQDFSNHHKLIDYVLENTALYPEAALGETIFALKNIIPNAHFTQSGYEKLKQQVQDVLNKELDQGPRSPDDWAIKIQQSCNCEPCTIANEFLQSSKEIERIWPLAADGRYHIAHVFNELELPVDLSTIEGSRPYKLVMKKNPRLFDDAQKHFKELSELYENILNIQEVLTIDHP